MFTITINNQLNEFKKKLIIKSDSTIKNIIDDYIGLDHKEKYFILYHKLIGIDPNPMNNIILDGNKFHKKLYDIFPITTIKFILVVTVYEW